MKDDPGIQMLKAAIDGCDELHAKLAREHAEALSANALVAIATAHIEAAMQLLLAAGSPESAAAILYMCADELAVKAGTDGNDSNGDR